MKKINILVPELPDSISDATVHLWHKNEGDFIFTNELIVDIETDKIVLEILSPVTGILYKVLEHKGKLVKPNQVIGIIHESILKNINHNDHSATISNNHDVHINPVSKDLSNIYKDYNSPTIRKLINEHNISIDDIKHRTGLKGRITKQDIQNYINIQNNIQNQCISDTDYIQTVDNNVSICSDRKKIKTPMSRLRQTIAERLLLTKNNTAMLTTFNEVNMYSIIQIRKRYGDYFKKIHNVKLGFMSFYVKSVVEALKKYPDMNASIENQDVISYLYYDINIAISTSKGLITPVLKNVDHMSMSDIEKKIIEYVSKGESGKITFEDLSSGTFTISNGGVFGSLLSTPIINPPQTGILGIHAIKDRPIAINNEVKICPMMYIALTYDHRLIDGKTAIQFLNTIKDLLEDFTRISLNI
ncbi:MAG: dihydrolipoyllysine-residue succinyltransferase [Buchnera aphidicola (Eriosoma harunire)]